MRPATRNEFADYCLRRLGAPVIDINVDAMQIEDRIDDAIEYYREFHADGVERVYAPHQITEEDITNRMILLDDTFLDVVGVLDVGFSSGAWAQGVMAQQVLNFNAGGVSSSYVPYVIAMQHRASMKDVYVGSNNIRYNRNTFELYIEMNWQTDVKVGEFIVIDGYKVIDPTIYTTVWSDHWLGRYTTALIKKQWGENMKKFTGVQLPGGVTLDGQTIWQEATEEIRQLEEEMLLAWSIPPDDMVG